MTLKMKKIRLLIIEEHKAVRDALQIRLQSSPNIEVIAAHPTVASWKKFQLQSHDMPAADVNVVLWGLRGREQRSLRTIIDYIREFNALGMIVIILASFANDVEREMVLQAGAHRHLLKDINSVQLITEIEHLAAAHTA
jgi:DNA-binding NarL/FixJ family response regulator